MANGKEKVQFSCSSCGFKVQRWQGKCPNCGEWNSFEEEKVFVASKTSANFTPRGKVTKLSELKPWNEERLVTGISELDLVLGGGLVPGSLVLLGGDPGIGKSTLALQTAVNLEKSKRNIIYISGEESGQQIKLRSDRISLGNDLKIFTDTSLESVLGVLSSEQFDVAVIDSVQTLSSEQVNGVVGGVSQIAFITNSLMRLAKEKHTAIIIIGHVTKEGLLAGPKTLEHMVDTVLYLEGERFGNLRLLRCVKNRFGSTGEVGVFDMNENGLVEVSNPAELFLGHESSTLPGSAVTAVLEGNKVLMVEVQGLTVKTSFGYPRRATSGFDLNRMQLLLAILQKRLGIDLSSQDVYVNVAGGFKLEERAADLPVALSVLSSLSAEPLPQGVVAIGEIGLSGEIRPVRHLDKRIKEAEKLGFKKILLGRSNGKIASKKISLEYLENISSLTNLFPIKKK